MYAVNADNEYGLDVGSVTGQATEAGGTATFTVALRTQPSEAVTVSVTSRDTGEGRVSAGGGAPGGLDDPDLRAFGLEHGADGDGDRVQDPVDDGTVTWNVRLDPSSGDGNYDGLTDVDVSVSTTDDDGPPTVTLALNPASIAESGSGNVATVTARLSHPSGAATTVTVSAGSAWAAGSDAVIVIAAGATQAASDTATVVGGGQHEGRAGPHRHGDRDGRQRPDDGRRDDDGGDGGDPDASRTTTPAPTATLSLNPSSVSENGGISTVTATLSHPSSEPSTVTVSAVGGPLHGGHGRDDHDRGGGDRRPPPTP